MSLPAILFMRQSLNTDDGLKAYRGTAENTSHLDHSLAIQYKKTSGARTKTCLIMVLREGKTCPAWGVG